MKYEAPACEVIIAVTEFNILESSTGATTKKLEYEDL